MFYTAHRIIVVSIADELINFQNLIFSIHGTNLRQPAVSQTNCQRPFDTIIMTAAVTQISAINLNTTVYIYVSVNVRTRTKDSNHIREFYIIMNNNKDRKLNS